MPLFPQAAMQFTPWIVGAGDHRHHLRRAASRMVQPDLKKLVAYSSVSHLGFCMLGHLRAEPAGHGRRDARRC